MMAQILPSSPARISQNLPIPKCSTCGQFVPLEELGDHICALPSRLPTPATTPASVHALLPKRLQGRVPSRGQRGSPSRSASRSPPLSIDISSRPHVDPTPSNVAQPTSASSRDTPTTARPSLAIPSTPRPTHGYHHSPVSPPRSTPPGQPPPFQVQGRGGSPLGYRGPPRGLPISPSSTQSNMLPRNMIPPRDTSSKSPQRLFPGTVGPGTGISGTHTPRQSLVPPPERGIDTKTGGEAGMAGVGRRGFAAVARAAMFALPPDRRMGPRPQRDSNQSKYLDIDAQSRQSGNSSSSPEPTSPLPQSEVATQSNATRTPSPFDRSLSTPIPPESLKHSTSDTMSTSPLSTRLPFFDNFRNKIPANNNTNTANNDSSISPLNSFTSKSMVRKKTLDSIDSVSLYRSTTSSSTSSRPLKDVRRPISPIDSESEYGGLAYADSIDNDGELSRSQSKNSSHPGMSTLILRTGSSSSGRRRQPSGSEQSEYSNDRPGMILIGSTTPRLNRSRTPSASSVSGSDDGPSTRARANSAAIAQALGLSQTPPSDYGKMGGPGVMGGRRRDSSISRRNADPDSLEEMEKALEEAKIKTRNKQPSFGSSSQHSHLYRADTTSSIATSRKDIDIIENGGVGVKSHRSNTIQSSNPTSPVKLPMRALTSPKFDRDKALDGTGVRKERVRKAKACLKCLKVIANERWVSVDGGGVLCEKCWKNMYLPKCRRCNLSIEKQAVSSSDGQLKGKYHKECFNCDTCHKPFPDKSFYVYDGKPLCAYHYHEANDSLCAAARCGQPIEGPCAVSHSGDRYHPEHMTCEHSGYPPCKQMLSEYWEIDGRMLCERHANSASVRGSDEEDEEWTKSKKRVTRFVDLTTGGIEGFGDSELR